jgi:N-acylglucosamine 2-epimerase
MTKNLLRRLLQPNGAGGLGDRAPLAFWSGWAWANQLRPALWQARTPRELPSADAAIARCTADFFRRHALEDLLPFWLDHSIDREYGGYDTHLDRRGRSNGDGSKWAAKQARMVNAFLLGHDLSGRQDHLDAAVHGFEFIIRYLWDERSSGWFTSVDRAGKPLDTRKNVVHHAYLLLGLASHYRFTGDPRALDWAERTHEIIETRMRDTSLGGYSLEWTRDWLPAKPQKDLCTLVDLAKAWLEFFAATGDGIYRDAARHVIDLMLERMYDPENRCLLEYWQKDWRYAPLPIRDTIDVGHQLKAGWLMIELAGATGVGNYRDCGLALIDRAIEVGWDRRHGGFFSFVFRNGLRSGPTKIWWPQCEAITALCHAWTATWDVSYLRRLAAHMDFTWANFIDPAYGEWYVLCDADGTVLDDNKGYAWKGAYHQVEAAHYAWRLLNKAERRSQDQRPAPDTEAV